MPVNEFGDTTIAPAQTGRNEFGDSVVASSSPSTVMDVLKSAGSQGVKDLAQVPMFLGDTANAVTQGVTRLGGAAKEGLANLGIGQHLTPEQAQMLTNPKLPFTGSQQVIDAAAPIIKSATGADINYQPQTGAGQATQSVVGAVPYAINPELSIPKAIQMGVGQFLGGQAGKAISSDPRAAQIGSIVGGGIAPMAPLEHLAASTKDIGSNLSGILGDTSSGAAPKEIPLNSSQVADIAGRSYDAADNLGGVLKPEAVNSAIDDAVKIGPQTEKGRAFAGDSETTKAINDLQVYKDKTLTLQEAQELDQDLSSRIDSETNALGKLSPDGKNLLQIRQTFRDALNNAGENDLVGGSDGIQAWREGQQLWATKSKMADIERIMTKAQGSDNPTTAIKQGFRNYVSNPKNLRGLSADEIADYQSAARTGILGGALKVAGSRLLSGAVGTAVGGLGGGPLGAAAGFGVGEALAYPLRSAAGALQRGRANTPYNSLANRPVIDRATQPASATVLGEPQGPTMPPKAITYNPTSQISAPDFLVNKTGNAWENNQTGVKEINSTKFDSRNTPATLQSESNRLLTSDAWNKIDAQQQSQIAQQVNSAYAAQQTPLPQIIDAALKAADDLNKVTGNSSTTMQEALRRAMAASPSEGKRILEQLKP